MKKNFILVVLIHLSLTLFSQAPQGISYQAIARDNSGNLLSEQNLVIRIGVLQNSSLIWQEDHTVQTNIHGLFTLIIGDQNVSRTGGTMEQFGDIPWSSGAFELEVSIDAGEGFSSTGISPIQSVPYALYAKNSEVNGLQELKIDAGVISISDDPSGNVIDLDSTIRSVSGWTGDGATITASRPVEISSEIGQTETPLFEVRNDIGNPVFAVFNDGVMVYVDEEKKSMKGGFAVGGYNSSRKGVTQEFLRITPDSVRIYVPDDPATKGVKGGFAVGGYNSSKGITDNYLEIERASTSIYFDSTSSRKGVKGGFAVGGYNSGKAGEPNQMMALTRENYFIGDEAGAAITRGRFNTFFGYKSGKSTTAGYRNVFLGYWTGTNNTTGANNVFIGNESGALNLEGMNNVFLGTAAGRSNSAGDRNVFIGNESGISNTQGYENVFIGSIAGRSNTTGFSNVFIGSGAGFSNSSGSGNIMLGRVAGYSGTAHNNNIFLGDSSGYFTDNQFATKNVFIGYAAGKNTQSYNNVFIGNRAGYKNTGGQNNIAIGDLAGLNNTSSQNIFIGTQAGMNNTDGFFNIIMGRYAGRNNTSGSQQVIIGGGAGSSLTTGQRNVILGGTAGSVNETGSNNVYLGYAAGWSNTGSGNIFIGYNSGYGVHQNVSNRLIVDNTATETPLIYGDFSNDNLRFNATVGIGRAPSSSYGLMVDGGTSTTYSMYVAKGAYVVGTLSALTLVQRSDERFKHNVSRIDNAQDLIQKLNGVFYDWKSEELPEEGFDDRRQIGLIAQEVEQVLPEVVFTDEDGYKSVNYSKITAVLIQAVKEQQAEIEQLKAENEKYAALDEKIRIMEEKLTILDNMAVK